MTRKHTKDRARLARMQQRAGHLNAQIAAATDIMDQLAEERAFSQPVYDRLDALAAVEGRWPISASVDIIDSSVSLRYQQQLLDQLDEAMNHLPPTQRLRLYGELMDANYRIGGPRR